MNKENIYKFYIMHCNLEHFIIINILVNSDKYLYSNKVLEFWVWLSM